MPKYSRRRRPAEYADSMEYARGETQEAGADGGGDASPGDYVYETVSVGGSKAFVKRAVMQYKDYGEEHELSYEKERSEDRRKEREEALSESREEEFDFGPTFYGDPYKGEPDGESYSGYERGNDIEELFR